jgi:hypothetical protein
LGNYDLGYLTILKPACIKAGGLGLVDTFKTHQNTIGVIFYLAGMVCIDELNLIA